MAGMMALVACGGAWAPATPKQIYVITLGQEACDHQQMHEDYATPPTHGYVYVVRAGSNSGYIENVETHKCREVLIVSNPKTWVKRA